MVLQWQAASVGQGHGVPSCWSPHLLQGEKEIITVQGAYGIYATVLKHSVSPQGINLITLEISYPRIVLAELNTHRMLCKNSSSSRAIPFQKMMDQLFGRPVRFGQANPGMQDKGEEYDSPLSIDGYFLTPEGGWDMARENAVEMSEVFYKAGYHKQVYNRLTEPFQMMKTVVTWTEGANFFWLRYHDAADPSLAELARVMHEATSQSTPQLLRPGEWHLPYVETCYSREDGIHYAIEVEGAFDFIDQDTNQKFKKLTLEEAIRVSSARSAAVSFRNVDYGVEKSQEVYDKLVSDERIHGSAMEHQATPMDAEGHDLCGCCELNVPTNPETWQEGITHMSRDGQLWSGPLRGWIQNRKLIPGENKGGFL